MGNKKDELLDLAQRQINAAQDADLAALDAANERELADQMETEALAASHKAEAEGLANYNKAQYANMGQILSDVQGKIDEAKQKDETARRRENAFRYISGLGDTLSGVANLIGTAHGAANQKQTYNSHAVVQKAEEARKARKLEMDELSKRLDEMTARQREMQAAGSLKEVELKARQDKEKAALAATQRMAAEEAKKYTDAQNYRAMRDVTEDLQRNRGFEEQQRQFDENQKRLAADAAANRKNQKEIAEARAAADLAKQQAKNAADPKHQAKALQSNITGVRDELAKKMGYADYNEYLRYQNVSGRGSEIDGQRNKESRRIRDERASQNPETEEFLNLLRSPESMTEEQIRMLMSASNVFAEAVYAAETEPSLTSNGKKKVW